MKMVAEIQPIVGTTPWEAYPLEGRLHIHNAAADHLKSGLWYTEISPSHFIYPPQI